MKKILLVAAMFVSVSMFAQSPLKKMTKVDVNPLTERTVTKAQTTRISAGMAKAKANAAEKNAPNYYLDYSDYAYNVGFSTRFHVAADVEFGNDGKVTFSNMLYSSMLPDAKITGTLNAAGTEITIDNCQKIGSIQGSELFLCRVHVDQSGNLTIDKENPVVLTYDKETGQIYAKDYQDSYLALANSTYDGFYTIAASLNYIPAEYFPAPTTHNYSYTDYDGNNHEGTVSMINLNLGNQEVCYVNGLFTEKMDDGQGNILADYSTAWTCAIYTESALTFPLLQTLADDIALAKLSGNQLSDGNIDFTYDASSDSYVQDSNYDLIDAFASQQGIGFSTSHKNSKIAKAGTAGVENVVNDGVNKDVVSTEYFDLSGRRISNIQKGAGIMVMKYADGTSKAVKVVK